MQLVAQTMSGGDFVGGGYGELFSVRQKYLSPMSLWLMMSALHVFAVSLVLSDNEDWLLQGGAHSQKPSVEAVHWNVMAVSFYEEVEAEVLEAEEPRDKPEQERIKNAFTENKVSEVKPLSKKVSKTESKVESKEKNKAEPLKKKPQAESLINKPKPPKSAPQKLTIPSADQNLMAQVSGSVEKINDSLSTAPEWVDTPNFSISPAAPTYPPLAKKRNQEGTVLIEIWINALGEKIKVAISKSSGFNLLDQSALNAANLWQFKPHKKNGVALQSRVLIPIEFSIQ